MPMVISYLYVPEERNCDSSAIPRVCKTWRIIFHLPVVSRMRLTGVPATVPLPERVLFAMAQLRDLEGALKRTQNGLEQEKRIVTGEVEEGHRLLDQTERGLLHTASTISFVVQSTLLFKGVSSLVDFCLSKIQIII